MALDNAVVRASGPSEVGDRPGFDAKGNQVGGFSKRAVSERSKEWEKPSTVASEQALLADVDNSPATVDALLDDLVQAVRRNVRSLGLSARKRLLMDTEIQEADLLVGLLSKLSREQRQRGDDEPQDMSKLSREELEKKARGR